MENEFVPYKQALELKELGFNQPCFGYYTGDKKHLQLRPNMGRMNEPSDDVPTAPTFSQAFRWFREKYKNLHGSIEQTNSYKDEYTVYIGTFGYIEGNLKDEPKVFISYEEAELECLKKLIEIVKQQKK